MKMNVVRDYQSPCVENTLIVIIKFAELWAVNKAEKDHKGNYLVQEKKIE